SFNSTRSTPVCQDKYCLCCRHLYIGLWRRLSGLVFGLVIVASLRVNKRQRHYLVSFVLAHYPEALGGAPEFGDVLQAQADGLALRGHDDNLLAVVSSQRLHAYQLACLGVHNGRPDADAAAGVRRKLRNLCALAITVLAYNKDART